MKNYLLPALFLITFQPGQAQTGWNIGAADSLRSKINFIESTLDGKVYQLCKDEAQTAFHYKIVCRDSSGTILMQASFPVSGNDISIRDFIIDTVQQRLITALQSSDAVQYTMQLRITDYNLSLIDSASCALLKSKADSCELKGGGIDTAQNKFLIYRFRSVPDQLWNRGVCRKDISGTYTLSTLKAGQIPNDGYTINTYAVTPSGNLFIGGSKKENLFGQLFYFEKLSASLSLVFEIKDQLIPFNTEDNHVSSLHVYNNNTSSQVVVCGSMYGLAPGDTVIRLHGVIRSYNGFGTLRWNYQNYKSRDYKKVIAKNNFVHAIGTSNGLPVGYNTVITRIYIKDGVEHWHSYYGNKSTPLSLQVEKDGSLLIAGSKQYYLPLQGGGTMKTQSYMLLRYSKIGKRLYDFNYNWSLPFNPTALNAGFTDIATGRNTFYYACGTSQIQFNPGSGTQTADSILLQEFTNGSLRTGKETATENTLLIHPNPAQETITFELKDPLTDIKIINAQGIPMKPVEFFQIENSYQCNVSGLKPGVYLLEVKTQHVHLTGKFIKE